jgi:hypothetical protein
LFSHIFSSLDLSGMWFGHTARSNPPKSMSAASGGSPMGRLSGFPGRHNDADKVPSPGIAPVFIGLMR